MDSSTDKNHILEDFQACTNIEDIGHAISVLESYNWNLLDAINSVFPQQEQLAEFETVPGASNNADIQVQGVSYPILVDDLPETSCTSSAFTRSITFTVIYLQHETLRMTLPDSSAVEDIKEWLSKRLSIAKDQMSLVWEDGRFNGTDKTTLRELHLPKENVLHLFVTPLSTSCRVPPCEDVQLKILYKDTGQVYDLNFRSTDTVMAVKMGVASVINVLVSQQLWSGWPAQPLQGDDSLLSECGLTRPVHLLEVCSRRHRTATTGSPVVAAVFSTPVSQWQQREIDVEVEDEPIVVDDSNDSDGVDEFHSLDEDDSLSIEQGHPARLDRLHRLIPEDVIEYASALESFNTEFSRRYGSSRPDFYVGGLDEAVHDALQVNAHERRPLAIYLHHDKSVSANIFCSQVLCSEAVVNYLTSNFLTWAWDLTLPANKDRLVSQATTVLGNFAGDAIQRMHVDELPLLLIVSKSRSSYEIFATQHATVSVEELINGLIQAVDVFQQQQQLDIVEETERAAREFEKYQQDAAYALSLAADKAKEEAKKREAQERRGKEAEQKQLEEYDKQAKLSEYTAKQALLNSLACEVPNEPDATISSQSVSTLRVRCPDGTTLNRRFLVTDRIGSVIAFLASKGFVPNDYRLLTAYPKRELSLAEKDRTLLELKLFPQETLILEAR